jgi:NAD(P)-dependent dehydrogenase (short-subunit alcohol dehydrogenase family)
MNTMKTKPQVVVVTGASAGVGRAVARRFAQAGACHGLIARDTERLKATQREIEAVGGRAVVLVGDVADPEAHERLAELTEEAFGPLDVWVNNAMASVYSLIWEMPPEEFKRVTEVTYLGVVYGTQAALRRMRPRNRGTIVQIGSSLAYRSIPYQSAYCAAKHAIHGFTDSLRSELRHDRSKIRLTMVQLPAINTPQFVWVKSRLPQAAKPPSPIYEPEVAADAVYWAAQHDRREVYLGYMTSLGIKVNKVLPGLLDRYLVNRSFGKTDQPRDPAQPDNLWQPAPGNWGARGPFSDEAVAHSVQFELSKRRGLLLAVGATCAAVAWAMRRQRQARPRSRSTAARPARVRSDRRAF